MVCAPIVPSVSEVLRQPGDPGDPGERVCTFDFTQTSEVVILKNFECFKKKIAERQTLFCAIVSPGVQPY